jgi:hypothetical protein
MVEWNTSDSECLPLLLFVMLLLLSDVLGALRSCTLQYGPNCSWFSNVRYLLVMLHWMICFWWEFHVDKGKGGVFHAETIMNWQIWCRYLNKSTVFDFFYLLWVCGFYDDKKNVYCVWKPPPLPLYRLLYLTWACQVSKNQNWVFRNPKHMPLRQTPTICRNDAINKLIQISTDVSLYNGTRNQIVFKFIFSFPGLLDQTYFQKLANNFFGVVQFWIKL